MDFISDSSLNDYINWSKNKRWYEYFESYDYSNYSYEDFKKDRRAVFLYINGVTPEDLKHTTYEDIVHGYFRFMHFKDFNSNYDDYRKHFNRDKSKGFRLKNRINDMLQDKRCLFITITFSDNDLKLSKDTRKRYVKEWLKNQCSDYVANIDYGSENGREHYHAVVLPITDKVDLSPEARRTEGNINIKHIYSQKALQLAHYLVKLCNHAVKDSTKGERTIYSRRKKKN